MCRVTTNDQNSLMMNCCEELPMSRNTTRWVKSCKYILCRYSHGVGIFGFWNPATTRVLQCHHSRVRQRVSTSKCCRHPNCLRMGCSNYPSLANRIGQPDPFAQQPSVHWLCFHTRKGSLQMSGSHSDRHNLNPY